MSVEAGAPAHVPSPEGRTSSGYGDRVCPRVHFHDLRHTGSTVTSTRAGAGTRELMARLGHDNMRAALIYQHATSERDKVIAGAGQPPYRAERQGAIGHVERARQPKHRKSRGREQAP